MRMTFRLIIIGGLIVFFAVVAVVVFIPKIVWNPPQTLVAQDYAGLQAEGRKLFYSNGCNYCHTQYVRLEDTAMGPVKFENGQMVGYPGEIGQWQSGIFEVVAPADNRTCDEPLYPKPAWPSL